MSSSLPEDYLQWLGSQIRAEDGILDRYLDLVVLLFEKEYALAAALHIPNDDNRIGDGRALREEFCHDRHLPAHCLDNLGPGSFLEVLIGLSRRLSFAAGGDARHWAWQLLDNLKLTRYQGHITRSRARRIDDILDTVIWRTYQDDGVGGFFPLAWPDRDQRKVELWYQMAAYIEELHPEH